MNETVVSGKQEFKEEMQELWAFARAGSRKRRRTLMELREEVAGKNLQNEDETRSSERVRDTD
jgi:hypothetical protein